MKTALAAVVIVATLAAALTAAMHVDPGIVGLLVAVAFAAVAAWAGKVALDLHAPDDCSEPRHRPAVAEDRSEPAPSAVTRKGAFGRLWGFAVAAFGVAALVPLISLGRRAPRSLGTGWKRGLRLVTADGTPVRPDDIDVGGVTTVFPEGKTEAGDAATLLIRVETDAMMTDKAWSPHGTLAFSKICTHAGCPVAIYRHADYLLYCPCHQSEFSVLFGAKPVSGPATRALPQLALEIGPDGYLVAGGDFNGPVGPDDWSRPI